MTLDWEQYLKKARETVAEGCVLIKNENNVLPLKKDSKVSIFGRIQNHYYKSGTGSGGMVNVSKVTGVLDALRDCPEIQINEDLAKVYLDWDKEHPFDKGIGWGNEPWSQLEMEVSDELVKNAAAFSDTAIVIIGRTAGEDKDAGLTEGSYLLTKIEEDMLAKVSANFKKVIILLNVGAVVDMSFMEKYNPDSVMYIWQGGMNGGEGVADLLTGKANPSGKLTDTIVYKISDYPSDKNFGDDTRNFYQEDIYVGYRYFETFNKDAVRYPFGYGLSYSTFQIKAAETKKDEKSVTFEVSVKNTGNYDGKQTVQFYVEAPQGKLGKASRSLCGFYKTNVISAGKEETFTYTINMADIASYDDSGASGFKSAYVLEAGDYNFYIGDNVRNAEKSGTVNIAKTVLVKQMTQVLAPTMEYTRMRPVSQGNGFKVEYEKVPVAESNMDELRASKTPADIPYTGDKGIKLVDVRDGKNTMEEFVAQFTDDDLCCIVRGEGMGSLKVTLGTAAAFGGVNKHLAEMGIPCGCCDDGPSGLRLDSGVKAFNMPNGTLMACTFNPQLMTDLYTFTGLEMKYQKIDCLLGPGMNIHRHPLNGRNFEYFSEDPLVTGVMAVSQLKGLNKSNVTGTIKHFCGNNQEKRRHYIDSVISERALREIYLKGFEMAVKEGKATTVMTTYGALNGRWTAGSYDLTTTVLREEWGFKGFAMTDWFACINEFGKPQDRTNFAAMVRAQNDVYMVVPDSSYASTGDNLEESLKNGSLKRGELQRCAANICDFLMNSNALSNLLNENEKVEIINRPKDVDDVEIPEDLQIYHAVKEIEIPLTEKPSVKGANFIFALEAEMPGEVRVTLTGSSELSELAQIPCTLFYQGIPIASFTFNGTGGKDVDVVRPARMYSPYAVFRLNVGQDGLKLKSLKIEFISKVPETNYNF
ncbi:MAG: glycoside hydrolase family 3 C-terminal domain-containing protein [Treponema sp.]|nr:glycoside hydrolase family 3 C-terminal domain-containing protein [Treponema sp.]